MSEFKQLKKAESLHDIAAVLGYKPKALAYILYKLDASAKYNSFEIPKRNGGMRTISAPEPELKKLQRRLADLLEKCEREIKAAELIVNTPAHGFVKHRSIITNAAAHKKRRFVFNLDLSDFFPNINFGRVRGFFIKNRYYALKPPVATILAQIACDGNALPQGSPCSPIISNILANLLDVRLAKIASKSGCHYTRYADDLTFSTNKRDFPSAIAKPVAGVAQAWEPGDELRREIERTGFQINPKKSRLSFCQSQQVVTGLTVNRKVSVPFRYRHETRAMSHALFNTGEYYVNKMTRDASGNVEVTKVQGTRSRLRGRLNFAEQVIAFNRKVTALQHSKETHLTSEVMSADERLYRDFLFFDQFYANDAPLIICEGKTDSTYLKCAIRRLGDSFPNLCEVIDGKAKRKVTFFRYSKTSARILKLAGGSPPLRDFLLKYKNRCAAFRSKGLQHPVIAVVDNDSGGSVIFNSLKIEKTDTQPFYHVGQNLYVIKTPLLPGLPETEMEDFFDSSVTSVVLGGKTFNRKSDADSTTHYGKFVFSEAVVQRNRDSIDFSGFCTLLSRIDQAISHYVKIRSTS